jgi:CheY-like chemotaxis protein
MVEDEALTALSLQDALEQSGFVVHHASDGEEASDYLKDHHGALAAIVTDIRFGPGIDGWEVARRARELDADIPVIYMSGDSAHEHARQGVSESFIL